MTTLLISEIVDVARQFVLGIASGLLAISASVTAEISGDTGTALSAATADELRSLLGQQKATAVFFDLDETRVMPQTTFIYGLPRSDAYVSGLSLCMKETFESTVAKHMEEAYYNAPLEMVSPKLQPLIESLRASDVFGFGLTSRSETEEYAWHNKVVVNFSLARGVKFSSTSDAENGIFCAGDENVYSGGNTTLNRSGKAMVIDRVMHRISSTQGRRERGVAVLVDNTLKKLTAAMEQSKSVISGIHDQEAWSKEAPTSAMQLWFCNALRVDGKS